MDAYRTAALGGMNVSCLWMINYTSPKSDKGSGSHNHTIKKNISKLENIEDESDISEKEYLDFKFRCSLSNDSKFIKKVRHIYPQNDLFWEVDEFDNGYQLIIAEIEIPIKTFKLKIPDFIKKVCLLEVTGLKQFSNRSLSLDIKKNGIQI
jgi:CYTH domain-containing protein